VLSIASIRVMHYKHSEQRSRPIHEAASSTTVTPARYGSHAPAAAATAAAAVALAGSSSEVSQNAAVSVLARAVVQ
jgi:hypothetical protein